MIMRSNTAADVCRVLPLKNYRIFNIKGEISMHVSLRPEWIEIWCGTPWGENQSMWFVEYCDGKGRLGVACAETEEQAVAEAAEWHVPIFREVQPTTVFQAKPRRLMGGPMADGIAAPAKEWQDDRTESNPAGDPNDDDLSCDVVGHSQMVMDIERHEDVQKQLRRAYGAARAANAELVRCLMVGEATDLAHVLLNTAATESIMAASLIIVHVEAASLARCAERLAELDTKSNG